MEGRLSFGFLFAFATVFAEDGSLRVDAEPSAVSALEDVGEDSLFGDFAG